MKRVTCGLIFVTVVTGSSCSLIKRKHGGAPPPMIAAPPTKPPQPEDNPQVPPPPKVEQAKIPTVAPPVASEIPARPPIAKPKPVRTKPVRKPAAAPVKTAQAPPPVEIAPPAPVLAPVLSAAQQDAFNKAIDLAIQQAESGLAVVASKQLNEIQRANADRARSFVAQAQQTRSTDLATAKTLADRAVVLAQSLVAELR